MPDQLHAVCLKKDEQGLALVSVLWVLSILSLIAATIVASSGLSYKMTRNAIIEAQARSLENAGITRAILGLLDNRMDYRWRVDGAAQTFRFDGAAMQISIQDELGKIDINAADGTTLERLLKWGGATPRKSAILADRVLDWRSKSPLKRLHGASAADYRAAGLRYHPRNGAFQSVNEIKLVLGMTPALFDKIEPAITVYSHRPMVEPGTATKAALMAQTGIDAASAQDLMRGRLEPNASVTSGGIVSYGKLNAGISIAGRAFSIQVRLTYHGRTFRRDAIVQMTGDPKRPYITLSLQ